ncbi:F-box protein [Vitis vinifera]|uniref:F-box protein n=1 Tax=Vitis vinifera TaxID=29760 RepID=A0A438ICU9_VITVI|nr:F-box protein [Vitis vinifera]
MSTPLERYQKLGLRDSLPRIYQYPFVCKELSFILRGAYNKLPKNLQSLVFQDTLAAFRLLPQHRVLFQQLISSCRVQRPCCQSRRELRQLQKFKHAKVACKRRSKARQEEEGLAHLPQDVLVHIFSFLDMQSLLSVGLACWSWNSAASDNCLWQLQYAICFGNSEDISKMKGRRDGELVEDKEETNLKEDIATRTGVDWRDAFKRKYKGKRAKRCTSNRGYCGVCHTIVWLSNMKCPKRHPGVKSENQQIKPVSPQQIVEYILDDSLSMTSSSDSDSDSEGGLLSKLWTYPRYIGID